MGYIPFVFLRNPCHQDSYISKVHLHLSLDTIFFLSSSSMMSFVFWTFVESPVPTSVELAQQLSKFSHSQLSFYPPQLSQFASPKLSHQILLQLFAISPSPFIFSSCQIYSAESVFSFQHPYLSRFEFRPSISENLDHV